MGLLFTSNHGSGTVTPAPTPIVSLSAQLACKIEMRIDGIRAAAAAQSNGTSMGVFQIDGNGAGAFKKLEGLVDFLGVNNTVTRWRISNPGEGGSQTANVSMSALPANGNDIILYAHWDQTHFNQSLAIFDATGTLFASASTTANDGNLPVTASNGILTINAAWDGTSQPNMYHAFALYSSSQPFPSWSQAPHTGEATLVYLLKFNDPPSPAVASASVGQTGAMLETAGNYYWFIDSGSAPIWFPPTATPTSISFQYPTTYISIGGFGGITASVVDQFGDPVINPTILWTISPVSTASINIVGTVTGSNSGTAYVTASVSGSSLTGQAIVSVSAYDWASNNLSIITVDVTGTFTYRGGLGLATITCSRFGTQVTGYAGVTGSAIANIFPVNIPLVVSSSIEGVSITTNGGGGGFTPSAAHPNEPSGFMTIVDTGVITGSVNTFNSQMAVANGTWTTFHNGTTNVWSNTTSPFSQSGIHCGYMLMLASGSGIRQRYDQQLAGGSNYVQWGTPISPSGSGCVYMSAMVRWIGYSTANQGSGNIAGQKMWEPRCGGPNSGGGQENHVASANCNNMRHIQDFGAQFLKQINAGASAPTGGATENYCREDISPFSIYDIQTPNCNLSQSNQEYVQVEFIIQQETTANTTADARVQYYVSGVLAYDSANSSAPGTDYDGAQGAFNLLAANSIRGWYYWQSNATFGGSATGPIQTQYFDIDQMYASVSPPYLAGAAYTNAAVNWTGSTGGSGGGSNFVFNAAHQNEPSGFSPQIDTGMITGSVTAFQNTMGTVGGTWTTLHNGISNVWTNGSNVGAGQVPWFIMLASGSGFRQRYDSNMSEGDNYVTFSSPIRDAGSGGVYISALIRFINWVNVAGTTGTSSPKLFEPRCGQNSENHVVGVFADTTSLVGSNGNFMWFAAQTPTGDFPNVDAHGWVSMASQYPTLAVFDNTQEYQQIEVIAIQETTPGSSGDANIIMFINNILAFDAVNKPGPVGGAITNLLNAASTRGWQFLTFNSVYGGLGIPPQTQWFDIDQIYVSVSPSHLTSSNAVYAAAKVNWTGSCGTNFPHEPTGMTPVVWTGPISVAPNTSSDGGTWTTSFGGVTNTWTMNSPTSITVDGEQASNLSIAPNNTGWRIAMSSSLTPGATPVQFFPNNFSTSGTGYYYQRWNVKLSPLYSNGPTSGGNPGIKIAEPRTNIQGPGPTQVNDYFGISAQNPGDGNGWVTMGLQGVSTYVIPNYLAPPSNGDYSNQQMFDGFQGLASNGSQGHTTIGNIGGANSGSFHTVEYLFTPESSAGAGDGKYALWVDGQAAMTGSSIEWRPASTNQGWVSFYIGPTYGGAKSSPPYDGIYYEIDQIYISVK